MLIGISGKIGSGKDTIGNIIQYLTLHKGAELNYQPNGEEFKRLMKNFVEIGYMPVPANLESGWEIKKFAGKLKEIVALLTGCSLDDLEDQEFKSLQLSEEWWTYKHLYTGTSLEPCLKYSKRPISDLSPEDFKSLDNTGRITKPTYRLLLQLIGTEAMREVVGENVWVNALFSEYKSKEWEEQGVYPESKWIITDMRFPNELKAVEERGGITIRVNRNWKFVEGLKTVNNNIPLNLQHPSETALDNASFRYIIENNGTIEQLIENVRTLLIH